MKKFLKRKNNFKRKKEKDIKKHIYLIIQENDQGNTVNDIQFPQPVNIPNETSYAEMDAFWLNILKPLKHKPEKEVFIVYYSLL